MDAKWYRPDGDVFLRHRNAEASEDLIIPVDIVCNTPDETLFSNIAVNSARVRDWLEVSEPHDGVAILCGSGPSLAGSLEEIRRHQSDGAHVFALNGAAAYLAANGITADYQVICDAQEKTLALVGPARAHLFASQVNPALFDAVPSAKLWHLNVCEDFADFEKHLPAHEGAYALIGGTASVGNVATCLAYSMGYRDLHCYGYDSSHRDTRSHASEQAINAGEPLTRVNFMGREFLTSFTMKSQADTFYRHAKALEEGGAKIDVHGDGLLPTIWRWHRDTPIAKREVEKYEAMWEHASYRAHSPGEARYHEIIAHLMPEKGDSFLDLGCGTGRLAALLARDYAVVAVDFAENALDPGIEVPFMQANLWALPRSLKAKFGVCCDVMEHIPPELIDAVLENIARACPTVYFRIDMAPDEMGSLIGAPLHLSVFDETFWAAKLLEHWRLVHIVNEGTFIARKEMG